MTRVGRCARVERILYTQLTINTQATILSSHHPKPHMSTSPLITAVVQLNTTPELETSLELATTLTRDAAQHGARFITLPENAPCLGPDGGYPSITQPLDGPIVSRFQTLARDLNVAILLGSFAETCPDPNKFYNTSVLIDPSGQRCASYRKIHLFDVETPNGQRLLESAIMLPGQHPTLAELGPWRIGLTICYDLRFPELFRHLVDQGAHLFCVPSAFTAETGRDHWLPLLRARAIENQAFVVAPNQVGLHFAQRRSYGRSAIIDPWGTVLATCPDRPSIALASLDLDALHDLRTRFPTLQHRTM